MGFGKVFGLLVTLANIRWNAILLGKHLLEATKFHPSWIFVHVELFFFL